MARSARCASRNAKPSMVGILMSKRMSFGQYCRASAKPSVPSRAVRTRNLDISRKAAKPSRLLSSSSTMRISDRSKATFPASLNASSVHTCGAKGAARVRLRRPKFVYEPPCDHRFLSVGLSALSWLQSKPLLLRELERLRLSRSSTIGIGQSRAPLPTSNSRTTRTWSGL